MELETRKVRKDPEDDEPIETHLVRVYIDSECRTVFAVYYDRELDTLRIGYNSDSISADANSKRETKKSEG